MTPLEEALARQSRPRGLARPMVEFEHGGGLSENLSIDDPGGVGEQTWKLMESRRADQYAKEDAHRRLHAGPLVITPKAPSMGAPTWQPTNPVPIPPAAKPTIDSERAVQQAFQQELRGRPRRDRDLMAAANAAEAAGGHFSEAGDASANSRPPVLQQALLHDQGQTGYMEDTPWGLSYVPAPIATQGRRNIGIRKMIGGR